MNCFNNITKYISDETFTYNNKIYNKVNITSNWNNIALRIYNRTTNTVSAYSEYSIPEGAYSYDDLYNAIYTLTSQFLENKTFSCSKAYYSFSDTSVFPNYGTYESHYNAILFNNTSNINYIDFVAMDNGLQQILPFTVPLPVCHNKDYLDVIRVSQDNRTAKYIYIFSHPYFFDMIWLNPYFFQTFESYTVKSPNNFIGGACNYNGTFAMTTELGDLIPVNWINIGLYVNEGVYSSLGIYVMMLVASCNSQFVGSSNPCRFAIQFDSNMNIIIYRTGDDNNWSFIKTGNMFSQNIGNYYFELFDPDNFIQPNIIVNVNYLKLNMSITVINNNFNYKQNVNNTYFGTSIANNI